MVTCHLRSTSEKQLNVPKVFLIPSDEVTLNHISPERNLVPCITVLLFRNIYMCFEDTSFLTIINKSNVMNVLVVQDGRPINESSSKQIL